MRKSPAIAGIAAIVITALLSACTSPPTTPAAPPPAPAVQRLDSSRTITLTGTVTDGPGYVTGSFSFGTLRDEDGTLYAVGTFTGSVLDVDGETSSQTSVAIPVLPGVGSGPGTSGSCAGLRLQLLPDEVSLLGVTVRFDPTLIDIVSAPGNLLGSLVCQAGSLVGTALGGTARLVGGTARQLVGLLNQILFLLLPV